MKLIFKENVKNFSDVKDVIKKNNINIPEYRLAVIALLEDNDGHIILQRRGPKSRDEHNMLEDIGGAVENNDVDLVSALRREIKEEVGDEAVIEIGSFKAAVLETKYDIRTNSDVNWLFCLFNCKYLGGNLLINEEGKCLGYEFYNKNDLPLDQMSATSIYFNSIK